MLLGGGRVIVAGGTDAVSGDFLDSTELYDPATGSWSVGPFMRRAHPLHLMAEHFFPRSAP